MSKGDYKQIKSDIFTASILMTRRYEEVLYAQENVDKSTHT